MELDIQKACRMGDTGILHQILSSNPEMLNSLDVKLGWAPIYRAVICGQLAATELLLKFGADPNIRNRLGESPLHQASDNQNHAIADILLQYNADPNLQTKEGDTPLHVAAFRGDEKMVYLLLKYKADPNMQNHTYERTPLHYAVDFQHLRCSELMISFEAFPLIKDKHGKTVLDLAEGAEMQRILVAQPVPVLVSPKFASITPKEMVFDDRPTAVFPTQASAEIEIQKERNPVLMGWLSSLRLECLHDVFVEGGYDDVGAMLAQMRSRIPINKRTLRDIGIAKPGHVVRVLAKLEQESVSKTTRRDVPNTNRSMFECCAPAPPAPGMFALPDLQQWLQKLNLIELYDQFMESGYDDLEQIYWLMTTNYPISDVVLQEEIGITRPGHRNRILATLSNELDGMMTSRRMVDIKDPTKAACEMCLLM